MRDFWRDLLYAGRSLGKTPGFLTVAVLVLAIGIGANSAIFSLVSSLLLRPLPAVGNQERLVGVFRTQRGRGFDNFSYPNYLSYRSRAKSFSGLIAYQFTPVILGHVAEPERIDGALVSGNYFSLLEVTPHLGRWFLPEEDRVPGTHTVVVLGYSLWQRAFGGDREVLGKTIKINGRDFTVIGITPRDFIGTDFLKRADVYLPIMMHDQVRPRSWAVLETRDNNWLRMIGRLAPGASLERANEELSTIAANLRLAYPKDNHDQGAVAAPGLGLVPNDRSEVSSLLVVLSVITGIVLLIVCVNLAALLLARAVVRSREIGIRAALGARRPQILRNLLAEILLLALLGGTASLLVATWLARVPAVLSPERLHLDPQIDVRVLGFTFAVSIFAGLLFGVIPSLMASRANLISLLHDGEIGPSPDKARLRNGLVVLQVALSLALLIPGGVLLRGLAKARQMDPGFRYEGVVVASLDLALQGYDETRGQIFYSQALARLDTNPSLSAVALSDGPPLSSSHSRTGIVIGQDPSTLDFEHCSCAPPPTGERLPVELSIVTPSYFEMLGIPILQGRNFGPQDHADGGRVVIVNETLAGVLWPRQNPIGKRLMAGAREESPDGYEVIGVAKNSKYISLKERNRPHLYFPLSQRYMASAVLLARGRSGSAAPPSVLRDEIKNLDAGVSLLRVRSLKEVVHSTLWTSRLVGTVIGGLGALALLLAALGLYALTSFFVAQRVREIGMRRALGADAGHVVRLVLVQGMKLTVLGVVLGLTTVPLMKPLVSRFLIGVSAADPVTVTLVSVLLLVTGILASYLPAWRASKMEPLAAIRGK